MYHPYQEPLLSSCSCNIIVLMATNADLLVLVISSRVGQVIRPSVFSEVNRGIDRVHTDDVFKSTVHRAANRNAVDRYSIALFFGTDYEVNIEARHSNIVFKQYLMPDPVHYSRSTLVCHLTTRRNIQLSPRESMWSNDWKPCIINLRSSSEPRIAIYYCV